MKYIICDERRKSDDSFNKFCVEKVTLYEKKM